MGVAISICSNYMPISICEAFVEPFSRLVPSFSLCSMAIFLFKYEITHRWMHSLFAMDSIFIPVIATDVDKGAFKKRKTS